MLVQVLNKNFHFKVCMNVRDSGLFFKNLPNNLCESQNYQKTVFPLILSGGCAVSCPAHWSSLHSGAEYDFITEIFSQLLAQTSLAGLLYHIN